MLAAASLAVFGFLIMGTDLRSEDGKSDSAADKKNGQSEKPAQNSPDKKAPSARKTLTGAELYSMHCNRCHPERYPTERTAAQWKTILLHMRVRANIPADQARTILKYLQDNSGR